MTLTRSSKALPHSARFWSVPRLRASAGRSGIGKRDLNIGMRRRSNRWVGCARRDGKWLMHVVGVRISVSGNVVAGDDWAEGVSGGNGIVRTVGFGAVANNQVARMGSGDPPTVASDVVSFDAIAKNRAGRDGSNSGSSVFHAVVTDRLGTGMHNDAVGPVKTGEAILDDSAVNDNALRAVVFGGAIDHYAGG